MTQLASSVFPVAGSNSSRPLAVSITTQSSPSNLFNCGELYELIGHGADQRRSPEAVSNASNPLSPAPPP